MRVSKGSALTRRQTRKSRRTVRRAALGLAVVYLVAAATLPAAAGATLRGSIGYALEYHDAEPLGPQTSTRLEGRLELNLDALPLLLAATAEPRLDLSDPGGLGSARASLGLTEAYVGYRTRNADLQVGRVRLPVESARLSVPYHIERYEADGRRYGREGVRADLYLGDRRLRAALLEVDGSWTPVVSLRQPASGWEATVHALVRERRLVTGVGASGLVGSLVLYGEAWSLPDEDGLRYALGASGYAGEFLWTGEIARAPSPLAAGMPDEFAAFQVAYSPTLGAAFTLDGAVGLQQEPPAMLGLGAVLELLPGRADLEAAVARATHGAGGSWTSVEAALRFYL